MNKKSRSSPVPKVVEEQACYIQGYRYPAGIDEVGRGCLAGPVVASAVIMPRGQRLPWHKRVRDSKLLTPEQREEISPYIHDAAVTVGTGVVDSYLIDQLGMTAAVHLAMRLAVTRLQPQPDYLLIDYLTVPTLKFPQKGVEDGDTLCFSIACASIIAKVYRDHLMKDLDRRYPGYGLARHKGYATAEHIICLRKLGPCPIHRRLFQPVKNAAQLSFEDWVQGTLKAEMDGT